MFMDMKKQFCALFTMLLGMSLNASAQENLQRGAIASQVEKTFTTVKEIPITSVKNQWRSGTCWAYATLGYFESEILRQTGRTYDLCEMFVVSKDYMDNATHYVRMHGFSQISEGGRHALCPHARIQSDLRGRLVRRCTRGHPPTRHLSGECYAGTRFADW